MTFLDTHVIVWLYAKRLDQLSDVAKSRIDSAERLVVSPMVGLELQYLYEISRVKLPAQAVISHLSKVIGLTVSDDHGFMTIIDHAIDAAWTRDPFDRIIVAHARSHDAELLSRDEAIRNHYEKALW